MNKGIEMRHSSLRIATCINLYPTQAQMFNGFAGFCSQWGRGGTRDTRAPKWSAKTVLHECDRHDDPEPWFRGMIFISGRKSERRQMEMAHELMHTALGLGAYLRRSRKLKTPPNLSKKELDLLWEEWATTCFSRMYWLANKWVKHGHDTHKLPDSVSCANPFPGEL